MAYKPKVLAVVEGGTGLSSIAANQILYATALNTLAALANGTTGQVLTATAGAPVWSTPSSGGLGYNLYTHCSISSPLASSTYFIAGHVLMTTYTVSGVPTRLYVPKTATIKAVYGAFTVQGTLASAQNVSVILRKNNTTDTVLSSTVQLTSSNVPLSFTGLNIAVTAGDYIEIKVVTPAWTTLPTSVVITCNIYME